MTSDQPDTRSGLQRTGVRRTALFFGAVALSFYLGFILLAVLSA